MIKTIRLDVPKELQEAFKNPKGLFEDALSESIEKSAIEVQREVKKNVIPGWNIGHKSWPMTHFEGRLNRSIIYVMLSKLAAKVGASTPYAAIQEFGGIIRPVMAKSLFIPMSPRGRKEGPSRGGVSSLIYGEDFIFLQKVEIKPKSYFSRGVDAALPGIRNLTNTMIKFILEKMGFK